MTNSTVVAVIDPRGMLKEITIHSFYISLYKLRVVHSFVNIVGFDTLIFLQGEQLFHILKAHIFPYDSFIHYFAIGKEETSLLPLSFQSTPLSIGIKS